MGILFDVFLEMTLLLLFLLIAYGTEFMSMLGILVPVGVTCLLLVSNSPVIAVVFFAASRNSKRFCTSVSLRTGVA